MKIFMSVRQFVFICSFISSIALLPVKGQAALISFQLFDSVNPMILTGMFRVDDADPNYGTGFQPLIDWGFFDMEGVPGIYTPDDTVVNAMALINLMNPNLSVLSFMSTDTAIPPIPPSGNTLILNTDNTWSSGAMNGNYIVRLISVHEPSILALLSFTLTCLFFHTRKRCRR